MCSLTRVNTADMMTFSSIQVLLRRVLWKTSDSCAIGNVNIATMIAQNRDPPSAYLRTIYNALYMGGMLVGSYLFGWASDQFGRKNALMAAVLTCSVSGFLG